MNTANPTVHMTMSIQLTATWTLAMSALVIMAALAVAWRLNSSGKLVDKKTGLPYNATPRFDPDGTRHFPPGDGNLLERLEDHECNTKNCERCQITKDGGALMNQQWASHSSDSRRTRFDVIARMSSYINIIWGTAADVFTTKPTLNALSKDEAVRNVADIAAFLTNESTDDTDYVSTLEALCRDIGRGCYAHEATQPLTPRPQVKTAISGGTASTR
jgi:hypothetical protein